MRPEGAWNQSFLSWIWELLQLWQPLRAASFRSSMSWLYHLSFLGGTDLFCASGKLFAKGGSQSMVVIRGSQDMDHVPTGWKDWGVWKWEGAETGTGSWLDRRPTSASTSTYYGPNQGQTQHCSFIWTCLGPVYLLYFLLSLCAT